MHDATPIGWGSSGSLVVGQTVYAMGSLVDAAGNLVGITSAIASLGGSQSGSIGLGFAIPVDQARVAADQLAEGTAVAHGRLGVQVSDSTSTVQRGALVERVSAGGPAERAGLRAGDIVTAFDGRLLEAGDALVAAVRLQQPNTTHGLAYVRAGRTLTVSVPLGSDASV